ncbi:hypothetical protein G9A89_012718 [Geosiphon pyriformis]|nr:hypothetical protein G9A89_012718 [Geosiphon pyriformis]
MATLPIETDIETILFKEITIGNYKDILQKRLGIILDSLVEARIIAFEKIKQFQKKFKKKKTYKIFSLSVGDLVLKYHSDKDNIYEVFLINMNNYFLDQNIQNAFYILHEYWIKNYPNATLTIRKQTTITEYSGTYTVIRPKKTITRRERIGSKMDKYLLESITAVILPPFNTIGKTLQEILLIDKNLLYERQLELYDCFGKIIEDIKLIKKTTLEMQTEILGIIQLDVSRVLTIAKRAKTLIQRFGLLDTKLILLQVLYTLSTKDFNKLVSFELDKILPIDYTINSLILLELNLFGENNVIVETYISY